ncbi:MFS transporter [Streptomyces sp. NPDC059766]|uniref:MFS transporter n=1 Tax=Streptomyces sp. NPDC059766 TaxID=3346940 RepID=UPI0036551080
MTELSPSQTKAGPDPSWDDRSPRKLTLLLGVACAVQFLDSMDIASIGPALPLVQDDLDISAAALQWVVSAYALGFGGLLLLGGRLADLYDRRKLLIGWLVVFAIASCAGGLADSGLVLSLARLVKGISAGITAPVAMAVLLDAFRDEASRNKALGTYMAVAATGYSLGLVFGGALAGTSWRLILFLPAVVGIAVAVLAAFVVEGGRSDRTRGRIDTLGALTVTTSAICLVYGFSRAATDGWGDSWTVLTLIAAAVLLGLFLLVERRHPDPLVPLSIFRRPQLARANVCLLFVGAYVAFQFVLMLYYQDALHWSPLESGLAFLLGGVLTGGTSRYAATLVTRYGAWPVGAAGLLMLTGGYLAWALLLGHAPTLLVMFVQQVLGGLGFAAAYPALNIAAVGQAREDEQGLASGLFNTSQQIGNGIVVAVTATALTLNTDSGLGGYRAGLWTVTAVTGLVTVLAVAGGLRYRRRDQGAPATGGA